MEKKMIRYQCGETTCQGFFFFNEIVQEARPGILVVPAFRGLDDFAKDRGEELGKLGFTVLVADIYGNGISVDTDEEASALMKPLFLDRQLLRDRVLAAYNTLKEQEGVDTKRIGAIGFCFGGLTVIELLRSGVPVRAVSFHGLLGHKLGEMEAPVVPNAEKIPGSLLMLHGDRDPLVSEEDIKNIRQELTDAGVDWQMNTYGHAVHAFTNPKLKDPSTGMAFNKEASEISWKAMRTFFDEKPWK